MTNHEPPHTKATEEGQPHKSLQVGDVAPDGSVFAGLTADGMQRIFAMPTDLDVCMTFNDAAQAIQSLNSGRALGNTDWQIPDLDTLKVLQARQLKGELKGTFNATNLSCGADHPAWYWSSTKDPGCLFNVYVVGFSDGAQVFYPKDLDHLSCRPVRLVEVSSVPAPAKRLSGA